VLVKIWIFTPTDPTLRTTHARDRNKRLRHISPSRSTGCRSPVSLLTACTVQSTRFNCIHCCESFSCAPSTSGDPAPAHLQMSLYLSHYCMHFPFNAIQLHPLLWTFLMRATHFRCPGSCPFMSLEKRANGVGGDPVAKRNWFCKFDRRMSLEYFFVQIMLWRCSCLCCVITCQQDGLRLQRVFGKIGSKPNETKRSLVWMVLPHM